MRSIYKKGVGVGIGRCVLWGGGSLPFLINCFNWFNINISIASIAISIDSPVLVATLGRYFTTLVWHPFPYPLPALCRSTVNFKVYEPRQASQNSRRMQMVVVGWSGGKMPDEKKRSRPSLWIVRQGSSTSGACVARVWL